MHTKDEPLALAPMEIQNQPPQTAVIQELSLLCYSSMKFFFYIYYCIPAAHQSPYANLI